MPNRTGRGRVYESESFVALVEYELKDVRREPGSAVCKGGSGTLSLRRHPFPARLQLGKRYVLRLADGEETWIFIVQGVPARGAKEAYPVVAGE